MSYRIVGLTMLACAAAVPVRAQQQNAPPAASTPAECVQQANQWRTRQVTEARAAQRPVRRTAARGC